MESKDSRSLYQLGRAEAAGMDEYSPKHYIPSDRTLHLHDDGIGIIAAQDILGSQGKWGNH